MNDLLNRVMGPAADLLERIDAGLTGFGAPPDHPVWPLLRRVGALPGDAVTHFSEMTPDPIEESQRHLRDLAARCRVEAEASGTLGWSGAAASAYTSRWAEISKSLSGDEDSLDVRIDATASYLSDIAAWIVTSRRVIAGELAVCLGARETVSLRAIGEPNLGLDRSTIVDAADLGARVLRVVAGCVDDGWEVRQRWTGVLGEVPPRTVEDRQPMPLAHIDVR